MTDLEINEAFGKPMYEADPTNSKYNSLQLQCYEHRKEIDRLNDRIKRLEREIELFREHVDYGDVSLVEAILKGEEIGRKEKESKP